MTIQKTIIVLIFLLCCHTNSYAKIKLSITPELGIMGGYAEYEMDYRVEGYTINTGEPISAELRLNSLLEFPLDTKLGGISLNLTSEDHPRRWDVNFKYLTALTDPTEKMKDTDWEGISTLFPYTKIIYTESDVESNMSVFEAEARFRVKRNYNFDLSVFFIGRYQDIQHEIYGYNGWYRTFDTVLVEYSDSIVAISGDIDSLALTYRLQVVQFGIGLQSNIFLSDKFTTMIKAGITPVFLNDTDDHVLRKKESTSNSIGLGYIADLNIRYDLPFKYVSYLQLKSSFNIFSAENSQMQLFYEHKAGLDPNTQFGSIPHEIRSKQYMISLQLGFQL